MINPPHQQRKELFPPEKINYYAHASLPDQWKRPGTLSSTKAKPGVAALPLLLPPPRDALDGSPGDALDGNTGDALDAGPDDAPNAIPSSCLHADNVLDAGPGDGLDTKPYVGAGRLRCCFNTCPRCSGAAFLPVFAIFCFRPARGGDRGRRWRSVALLAIAGGIVAKRRRNKKEQGSLLAASGIPPMLGW